MSARQDLARITEDAERAIDRPFAAAARRIGPVVDRHAVDGRITWAARAAILREVDGVLDALYGPHRGAPSPLLATIADHAGVAFGTPAVREAERLAALLAREPDLRKAVA